MLQPPSPLLIGAAGGRKEKPQMRRINLGNYVMISGAIERDKAVSSYVYYWPKWRA